MSSLVERLAELVKGVGLSTVYGEATELNGVHIMPVALSFHAFGAGEGRGNGGATTSQQFTGEGEGSGGGGVAVSVPIGAYIRDIRGLRFEANIVTLLAVATPFVWVTGRAFGHLTRTKKKRF